MKLFLLLYSVYKQSTVLGFEPSLPVGCSRFYGLSGSQCSPSINTPFLTGKCYWKQVHRDVKPSLCLTTLLLSFQCSKLPGSFSCLQHFHYIHYCLLWLAQLKFFTWFIFTRTPPQVALSKWHKAD